MKFVKNFLFKGIGANFAVFLALTLLPAYLVTDHVDVLEKVIAYILEK